jgi:hypothetical protein
MTKTFRVHIGGKRYRKFDTLQDACAFCSKVFAQTGIVLAITRC